MKEFLKTAVCISLVVWAADAGVFRQIASFLQMANTGTPSGSSTPEVASTTPVPAPPKPLEPTPEATPKIPGEVFCIRALQMPDGVVPIGAIFSVNTFSDGKYNVCWRGYTFSVSEEHVTLDRDYAAKLVAEGIEREKAAADEKAREAANRQRPVTDRQRMIAIMDANSPWDQQPSSPNSFSQSKTDIRRDSRVIAIDNSSAQRVAEEGRNREAQRRVINSDLKALELQRENLVLQDRAYKNANANSPSFSISSQLRATQNQIDTRKKQLDSLR